MGLAKFIPLFVLGVLTTCNGFNHLVPWDKEVVYDWSALVKAGTHFPVHYASQFVLHGKIHVQANHDVTHVQINDLTYKLYNGILDHVHEHESRELPVPPEVKELHNTFKIIHSGDGTVTGITTQSNEKEFSRNIKKAIASILQVNHTVVDPKQHFPHGFVAQEHSIYGWGDVDYNVLLQDDIIEVHKSHDMHHSGHLYQYFLTNTQPLHCDLWYEEPITHDSHRKYHIVKQDGHHVVKHIVATGGVYYNPHKGQSDSHYILVNQTFDLIHIAPIAQKLLVENEHVEKHLSYHAFDEHHQTDSWLDITNGRHVINYNILVTQVQPMFDDIWKYLQEDHIHTRTPNTERGQLINRVRRLLTQFDLHHLEELHATLVQKSGKHHVEVFYHILPLIGTKASVLFAKKLVVNKSIPDEIAVEVLQHLPEHIVEPTEDIIHELETIIHLGDDVNWNVRKMGILTFGTVVHKSWIYLKQIRNIHRYQVEGHHVHVDDEKDHFASQHVYEKYVAHYVKKVRDAHDYKIFTIWMQGLYNMKVHSIIHHLTPAIRGEWWKEPQWRSMALWTVLPSITYHDNETVIDLLWPILTNRHEHTELRILAYYFIMETHPSLSRLTNIYWHLMTERNEELYHFHYTYVNTHLHTLEPCHQQFRTHLAHIHKFMQPPSHGISFAYLHDYRDSIFGFSGGLSGALISSNDSQLLVAKHQFQISHVYHEDYKVILRLHGFKQKVHDLLQVAQLLTTDHSTILKSDHIFVEAIVIRHQHVIRSFYFDKNNVHDIQFFVDFITKDHNSHNRQHLHVDYNEFHKSLIPTDLGIPALWEYLVPSVTKFDIGITKEATNKIVKLHIDGRHVHWLHSRHGLTFYNPIVDVWQGVNRYHAYDAVSPIHLDVTINSQQQSVQISWRKHNEPHLNVAGLRSHVKQMVFVKDDYHRNLLVQSSPHAKEWVVVTRGDQFRNNYVLTNDDNLNTGHQWKAVVYDSGYHISNGTFSHLMSLFREPHHKHFESPIGHLVTSWLNFHNYLTYLPDPGMYGLMVRIEPSHQHSVTNVDLSVRFNVDEVNDNYVYAHGCKITTRLTYSVKNHEKSLKTWDLNAILDMNSGHTVNNVKMHFTRIIPGQKDYKICIEGVKKWSLHDVSGHLNVAMSQTPDGKCVKDDTVVDITMVGQKSHEQVHEHHIYGSCHYTVPYAVQPYHTLHCLASHTSVRHYTYNVKTVNVPTEFKQWFGHLWDHIKAYYISYYGFEEEHHTNIGDHTFKVDVMYPMQGHEVDVHVTTPQYVHKLTGVPSTNLQGLGLVPDSLVYSRHFVHLHDFGLLDHCVIHHDHHYYNHHYSHMTVPNDWTVYVGDKDSNPQRAVYVKHVADTKVAVKIVDNTHTFEIIPHGDTHQISLDGQVVSDNFQNNDWAQYHVFEYEAGHPVAALFPHLGVHVEYYRDHIIIVAPQYLHWHGQCYQG